MSNIKVRKISNRNSSKTLPEGFFIHDPEVLLSDKKYVKYNGEGIKIAIIGTGVPFHKDFGGNIEEYQNFSQDSTAEDRHGLSVQIAGILGANNPDDGVTGMAYGSDLYFAKAITDEGEGDINALNAAFLWSVVKHVDLIVIPFNIPEPNSTLLAAFQKAKDNNICVLSFGSKIRDELDGVKYYDGKKKHNIWTTTTGVADYAKPTVKIANMGIAAGAMALALNKQKKSKRLFTLEKVYTDFERIL